MEYIFRFNHKIIKTGSILLLAPNRFHVSPAAGYRDLSRLKNADALSGCSALKTIANYKANSE